MNPPPASHPAARPARRSGPSPVWIGIDAGTTALKVAAWDGRDGTRRAAAQALLPLQTDASGRRELAPTALPEALARALARLRRQLGRRWAAVAGFGLAAQGGSTQVVEAADGRPLTPLILWNDARAYPEFARLQATLDPEHWRHLTRRDEPGMGVARLRWLRQEQPDLFQPGRMAVGAGEVLFHRLTGLWRQDACHALQSGCYDGRTDTLGGEGPALAGVEPGFFAPLRPGHAPAPLAREAARRLGLPEGLPVAGPYMDHEAGFAAAARAAGSEEGLLQVSLGTAWVGNFLLPPGWSGHSPFQFSIPWTNGPARLAIQPLLTGNVTWDWALHTFAGSRGAAARQRAAAIFSTSLWPPPGLVFLPWLNRPNPALPGAFGAGHFLGLNPSAGRAEMLRAVTAGLAAELARIFAPLRAAGLAQRLVLSGGASRLPYLQALLAASCHPLPVELLEEEAWMGARGALAGLWAGPVSGGHTRPLPPPSPSDLAAAAAHQAAYATLLPLLYENEPAGHPYRLSPGLA